MEKDHFSDLKSDKKQEITTDPLSHHWFLG